MLDFEITHCTSHFGLAHVCDSSCRSCTVPDPMDTSRGARDGSVTLCAVDVLGEGQSCFNAFDVVFDAYMASLPCNMRVTAICQTVFEPQCFRRLGGRFHVASRRHCGGLSRARIAWVCVQSVRIWPADLIDVINGPGVALGPEDVHATGSTSTTSNHHMSS